VSKITKSLVLPSEKKATDFKKAAQLLKEGRDGVCSFSSEGSRWPFQGNRVHPGARGIASSDQSKGETQGFKDIAKQKGRGSDSKEHLLFKKPEPSAL